MQSRGRYRASLILAGALAASALLSAGAAEEPSYAGHHWDAREDQVYRAYLSEQQLEYREFHTLSPEQQQDYWNWRARHPDSAS